MKADIKVVDLAALTVYKRLQDLANAAFFVRKDGDKVLSTNDFTDAEKTSLATLTENFGGYTFATDAQVDSMLDDVFGS